MIIGLTVHDNDYQDILVSFAKRVAAGLFIMEEPPSEHDHRQNAWYNWYRKTNNVCKQAVKSSTPTDEQKQTVIDALQRSWKAFTASDDNAEYLANRLEITVPGHITDEWQNGEQIYVFPTSYEGNILCF